MIGCRVWEKGWEFEGSLRGVMEVVGGEDSKRRGVGARGLYEDVYEDGGDCGEDYGAQEAVEPA